MMHQNNRSLWSAETESKLHYKMYKAGKMWLFAGITLFMFGAASGLSTSSAHADTTNAAQSSISATSSTSDDLNTANTSSVTKTSSVDNASATSNTQKSSISATSASSVTVSAVQKSDATNTESKSVVASSEQASDNKLAATTSANETKNADSVTSASSQVSQSEANTKVGNGASTISDNISSQATTSATSANVKVSENQASENVASSTTVKPVESSATLISPNNEQISAVKSKLADMASQTGQAQSFALVDDTTSTTSTTSTQMTGVTLLAQKDAQTLSNISLPTDLTYILSKDRSTLYALSDATYLGTPLLPAYFQGNVIKTVVNETKAQYAQSVINSLASTVQTEVSSDGKGLTAITPGGDNYTTVDFGNYYATISDQTRQQYAQNQIAALPTGLTAHASDNGNTLYIVTPDGYTGKQYGTSDFGQYYQSVEMTTELQYEREVAATAIQALPSGTEITVGGVGDLVKHTLTLTSPAGNPITLSGDATNGYYVTFDVYDNKTGQTLKQQKYFIGTLFSNVQVNTPNSIFSNIANLNTASYGYKDALSDIQYSAVVDWEDMLNHPQTWQGASFPTSGSLLQNDQDTYHQTVYEIAVLFKDYVKQLSQTLPTYFSNADNVKKLISTTSGDWLNFTNPSGKQWSGTSSDTAIAQNVNNWGAGSVFGQGAANPFTPNNQVMADFGKLSTAQITLFPHSGATGLIIDSVAGIPGGWDSSALNTAQSLISGGTLVAAAGHVKFSGLIQTIQMIKNLTQEGLVNGVVLSSLLTLGVNQNDAGWGIPLTDTGLIGTIKKDGLLHFNPTTLSDTGTSYYGIPKSIAAALWFDKNVPDAWLDGLSNEFKNSDNIVSLGHIETDSTNHTHDQDGWQVSIDPVTGLPVGSVNYTEDTAIPSIPFVSKDTIKSTLGLSLKNADNVPTHFDKDTESIYQTLVSTIVSALANQYSQGMQAAYAAMTKMSSTKVSDSNVANGLDGKITTTTWQSDTDQLKQAYDAGYAAALTWLQKYQQQGIADALSGNGAVSDPIGTYQGNMPFSLMKGAAATSTADQIAQIKANTRVSQMLQDAYLNAYNSANKAVTDFSKSTDLSNALTGTSTTGADSYAYLSTYKKIYQAALGNYKVFSTTAGDTASQLAAGPNIVDMAASSVVKASIVNGVYTTVSKIPAGTTISADRMVSPAFSTYLTNTKQTAVASALANVYNKAYNAQIILVNNAYTAGQASLLNDVTKAMTDADDFQNTGKYTAATNFSMPVDSGLTDASGHEIQNHIVYSATQDYTWNTTDKDGTGSQFYKLGYADEQKNVKSINVKYMEKANYKFNPNKPGIFQWQSVDDVFLMVVD
ncbi:hypothetical protein GB992_11605 [Lactobacillus rossiae]|uniref:KxYKxGKxW signal peptide domain-containing protein n=1 Tax=Furfurilactobacillus rossiae TaxID=231049 RepID=A0A7C9N8U7_9LACO|nr:hypothetical protein [Furfurilactobacillus milii]